MKSRVGGEVIELRNADDEIIRKVSTDGSILDISRTLRELSLTLPGETKVSISRPNMDDVFLAMTGGTEVAQV
ncbi:hypothetical protein [Paenibacillus zanthoxyli]|uniref:hypothetical protein n=1 Tax=Paenibacillus zanthoxyli TaxID=369399 RepID=UPI000471F149|nr:hypothetical protein [Paenibacillus zanthoxyli]